MCDVSRTAFEMRTADSSPLFRCGRTGVSISLEATSRDCTADLPLRFTRMEKGSSWPKDLVQCEFAIVSWSCG